MFFQVIEQLKFLHDLIEINGGKCVRNSMVVETGQIFQFFRQKTWFLGNNRGLPKFRYRILRNMISTTKL